MEPASAQLRPPHPPRSPVCSILELQSRRLFPHLRVQQCFSAFRLLVSDGECRGAFASSAADQDSQVRFGHAECRAMWDVWPSHEGRFALGRTPGDLLWAEASGMQGVWKTVLLQPKHRSASGRRGAPQRGGGRGVTAYGLQRPPVRGALSVQGRWGGSPAPPRPSAQPDR